MGKDQISDLATSILAGDRIPPVSIVPQNDSSAPTIPAGAAIITEGAKLHGVETRSIPSGAKTVNFTKDTET